MRGEEADREATKWVTGIWGTWDSRSLVEGREERNVRQHSDHTAIYSSLKYLRPLGLTAPAGVLYDLAPVPQCRGWTKVQTCLAGS